MSKSLICVIIVGAAIKRVSNVRGAVLQGSEVSLLGQSYLSRIRSVEMSGDYMVLR